MPTDIAKLPLGGPAWLRAIAEDKEEMVHAIGCIDAESEREEKREIQGPRDAADRMERLEKALYALDGAPLAGGAICEDCKTEAEYAKFVESMVPHCRCDRDRPCAGVLAGGLCDDIRDSDGDAGGTCGNEAAEASASSSAA